MDDEGRTATCCLRATDEELDTDDEAFDCGSCEYAAQQAALSDHDRMALRCYDLLRTAVVRDLKLTPLVFDVMQLRLSAGDALLLLEKLDVIHGHTATSADVPIGPEDHG